MAEVPRAHVIDWFLWLAREGLERVLSAVWDSLAANSADIEALELFHELRRAYDEGLIDPLSVGLSELDAVEAMPRGEMVRKTRERHPPIDDVAAAITWWDCRSLDTNTEDHLLRGCPPRDEGRSSALGLGAQRYSTSDSLISLW